MVAIGFSDVLALPFDSGNLAENQSPTFQVVEKKGEPNSRVRLFSYGSAWNCTEYVPVVLVGPVAVNWNGP